MENKINNKQDKTPAERLHAIRMQLKLSRGAIFKTHGLSIDTLKAWESGKLKLTEKNLDRCINIYRKEGIVVSKSWILSGEGLDPKLSQDLGKYFSNVATIQNISSENDTILIMKEADFFKATTKNAIILLVSTEEMLPYYAPGDYVAGRFKPIEQIELAIGKDCIILTKSGEKYFRRLAKHHTGNSYNLVCHNPIWGSTSEPVMYNVEIAGIAPVIWHRRADI